MWDITYVGYNISEIRMLQIQKTETINKPKNIFCNYQAYLNICPFYGHGACLGCILNGGRGSSLLSLSKRRTIIVRVNDASTRQKSESSAATDIGATNGLVGSSLRHWHGSTSSKGRRLVVGGARCGG